MADRPRRPARLTLTYLSGARSDYAALSPDEKQAARATLAGLAHGAVTAKALGERHVSGNLTGFARIKFDVPGQHPLGLRLVYRLTGPATAEVFAIGRRADHEIDRLVVDRVRGET